MATVAEDRFHAARPLPRTQATPWDVRSQRIVFGVLTAVAVVFLVGPTIIVLLTSFTATESLRFPPQGYSVLW